MQESVKQVYGQALATLIRLTGDFDLAEECLQEACLKAVETWQEEIPGNPLAWLVTTARNKATDIFRRQKFHRQSVAPFLESVDTEFQHSEQDILRKHINNDYLCLIFICCHPALNLETQIALTLKTVAGLSTEEVASALLVNTKTMEQRLLRAKRKIKQANIAYQVPNPRRLPERLSGVLKVIYLIFNEGYNASSGDEPVRKSLCREAVNLAGSLVELFPDQSEVLGLSALCHLQDARYSARLSPEGNLIPLAEQNRKLWDWKKIQTGKWLLDKALGLAHPGPYQIQAAIAVLHCTAESLETTDWQQILLLYDALLRVEPSSVVHLNRAVALARVEGNQAAIDIVLSLAEDRAMLNYAPYFVVLGHLYEAQEEWCQARSQFEKALAICKNFEERKYLQKKIISLSD